MLRLSIIVTALSLLGSFLGLLVQMSMAKHYGSGVEVDAYLYAISTPSFVASLLASMLSYTVVPRLATHTGSTDRQNRLIVSLLALVLCIGVGLLLLSPVLSSLQKQLLPHNSPISFEQNLPRLLYIGWAIAAIQIVFAALCAVLTGLKKAIIATVLNLGPYLGMVAFMFFATGKGTEQLAYGLLAGTGSSLCIALVILHTRWRRNWQYARWEEVRTIVISSPYTIIAMSCFSAYAVIDSYWAPRAGEGVLASLGYSQRIMIALGNLAVAGPSAILVPKFSEVIAQGIKLEFDRMFKKTLWYTFLIAFMLALGLFISADWLIKFLFVRGAFFEEDATHVASVLRYCLPGMVFMLVSVIILRVLFCFSNVEKYAAIIGIFWLLLYFSLSGVFIYFKAMGLALAYSATWLICMLILLAFINKKSNSI